MKNIILSCLLVLSILSITFVVHSQKNIKEDVNLPNQIDSSDVIVTGIFEKFYPVIDKQKMAVKNSKDGSLAMLPNPNEYQLGYIYIFRIANKLKTPKGFENEHIYVFVPGPLVLDGSPILLNKELLVFLKQFKDYENSRYDEAVFKFKDDEEVLFRSEELFLITDKKNGLILVSPENKASINQIKKNIEKNKSQN